MRTHLGEFEQLLLFALLRLDDRAYGVTIRREIEERTGRGISAGAVYTAMERLEHRGFVSSRLGEPVRVRGGRRRRFYRLEPAGLECLRRSQLAIERMREGLEAYLEIP